MPYLMPLLKTEVNPLDSAVEAYKGIAQEIRDRSAQHDEAGVGGQNK
jgi:hypothetical protein